MNSWEDDLFDREDLANDLIDYAKSVAKHGTLLDRERSLVVAVDADYGIGKTYFLKGLELLLKGTHPVAYVDAWSDDLMDEPLIALAAVLKQSMDPLLKSSETVRSKWKEFSRKTGRVVWIGGKGLLRRGAEFAITGAAVDGIVDVGSISDPEDVKALKDDLQDAVSDATERFEGQLKAIEANDLLNSRISEFQAGQTAIKDMHRSMSALVEAISATEFESPVFIIIDELDRCRPSYAVKLLEEVKHLFSVPGFVFILGLNTRQLGNAVSGIYGDKFEGEAYLDRFIDRKLKLPFPPLGLLVRHLWDGMGQSERLKFPNFRNDVCDMDVSDYIASLLEFYEITPRSTFTFFDKLQTFLAIAEVADLDGVYLTEIICEEISGGSKPRGRKFQLGYFDRFDRPIWEEGDKAVEGLRSAYKSNDKIAYQRFSGDSPFANFHSRFLGQGNGRSSPTNYASLLNSVQSLRE